MGIFVLASLVFPVLIAGVLLTACLVSLKRNGDLFLYKVVALASLALGAYIAYPAPLGSRSGGEYAGLQKLIEFSFSSLNIAVFVVGLGVLVMATAGKATQDKVMSGMAWGLASAFVVRSALVLVR